MKIRSKSEKERLLVWSFLFAFLAAVVIVVFSTDNSFGGGDPISHYKIAHWAWKYPKLFLDIWGKPVFTLLISPWAQFGMNGARFYNIAAGMIIAWLAWKICKQFDLENSWLAPVFVLFIPIYFVLMFTSLTEITFSLFLTLSFFLFFKDKLLWSGIVLSFIPLIRTEGIVLFPLFAAAFLMRRRYIAVFSLFTGFLIFSLAGLFVYHDFWWLITRNPYNGSAAGIYGHGMLFHFVYKLPAILGYPVTFLFLVGFIILTLRWLKEGKGRLTEWFYFLMLIPGSFLIYFAAHSYVWWKGIGNSLGLIRVIAAVAPAAALTAVVGFDKILIYLKKTSGMLMWPAAVAVILWIASIGIWTNQKSFELSPPDRLVNQTVTFVKSRHLEQDPVYYFDPYFIFKLGADPYGGKVKQWNPKGNDPVKALPAQSIVVWDAHFGPNEGNMPLGKLLKNNQLRLLKKIEPPQPFQVLGGYNYAVYIFQRLPVIKQQGMSQKVSSEN